MTYEELTNIIEKNNIPKNVKLMSDSGWEFSETDMDGVYYDNLCNILIFKQDISHMDRDYFNCLICVGGRFASFTNKDMLLPNKMGNPSGFNNYYL